MIAFIDDHREAYGVEPICKVLPIAPSTYHAHVARRADPATAAGAGAAGRGSEGRDPARVRGELPRLWRAQGLAAVAAGGLRRRPLHRGPADADHGPSGRDPRQAGADHDQRQGRALPARSREPPVPGAARRTCCGSRTSPMSRPGPASSMSPSSSTPTLAGSSAGGSAGRRTQASFSTPWNRRSMTEGPSSRGGLVHHSDRGEPRRIQAVVATRVFVG